MAKIPTVAFFAEPAVAEVVAVEAAAAAVGSRRESGVAAVAEILLVEAAVGELIAAIVVGSQAAVRISVLSLGNLLFLFRFY